MPIGFISCATLGEPRDLSPYAREKAKNRKDKPKRKITFSDVVRSLHNNVIKAVVSPKSSKILRERNQTEEDYPTGK